MTTAKDELRDEVRTHYARVAKSDGKAGCGPGCCSPSVDASLRLGYSADDLAAVPQGADLGLGCGTPLAFAALKPAEAVLDLGSGGGLDCFLAARQVGAAGKVIGVDMTPEMITKARANAERLGVGNIEFRLGEIEHLPVADASIDVIVSNCVINLSPDKAAVLREAFRALKPGGRLAIADILASAPLPAAVREGPNAMAGCIAGAAPIEEVKRQLREAGFTEIRIDLRPDSKQLLRDWNPDFPAGDYVASAAIHARRPRGDARVA